MCYGTYELNNTKESVQTMTDQERNDLSVMEQQVMGTEYENSATPMAVFLAHRARGSRKQEPSWRGSFVAPKI